MLCTILGHLRSGSNFMMGSTVFKIILSILKDIPLINKYSKTFIQKKILSILSVVYIIDKYTDTNKQILGLNTKIIIWWSHNTVLNLYSHYVSKIITYSFFVGSVFRVENLTTYCKARLALNSTHTAPT